MKHLIIIALLILSYGCAPKYTVPSADPLPVEQRNGISSLTMGFIKPDKRTVSYSYSYPDKQKIYNGYVLGSDKKSHSSHVYKLDVDSDFRNVIQSYVAAKFLKQSSESDINIDFVVKDFWIENGGDGGNRGGYVWKVSYITILNAIVDVKITDENTTVEKSFKLKRVIEKSKISGSFTSSSGNYTATASNTETFIDADISRELTEMYNILILMTDKFIESAKAEKSEKPVGSSPQPQPMIKKQPDKSQDIFKIR